MNVGSSAFWDCAADMIRGSNNRSRTANSASGVGDTHPGDHVAELLERIEQHLGAIREGILNEPRQWLTVAQVAEELQVSRDTVERLVASGRLRVSQVDTSEGNGRRHRYRIHRDWIDDFLQGNIRPMPPSDRPHRRRPYRGRYVDFIG
ncbi:MAG: helix-turn-helix domain-containing protein [Phycisphaerae bacterium]